MTTQDGGITYYPDFSPEAIRTRGLWRCFAPAYEFTGDLAFLNGYRRPRGGIEKVGPWRWRFQ